jgi:hypothetical protein
MVNFIRLSSVIINTVKISKIEIQENKYCIHLMNSNIDGFFLFSSGFIHTQNDKIEVCKIEQPTDYNSLTDWINRNS